MSDLKLNSISSIIISFLLITYLNGCGSSSDYEEEKEDTSEKKESVEKSESEQGNTILNIAKSEQNNKMYSPDVDSTYLYWLNNDLIFLNGSTKCNIFALNVLYKSGFKTPEVNALSRDLFDTANFRDILPVIAVNEITGARAGDIIAWRYHVIIFEALLTIREEQYAKGYWAGTRQKDNERNVKNNVCHGKYKLSSDYVVRRPGKK
ncbi:MAG: hypothetical protein ABI792_04305 [bacterium]